MGLEVCFEKKIQIDIKIINTTRIGAAAGIFTIFDIHAQGNKKIESNSTKCSKC